MMMMMIAHIFHFMLGKLFLLIITFYFCINPQIRPWVSVNWSYGRVLHADVTSDSTELQTTHNTALWSTYEVWSLKVARRETT